jgi:hypothetical protein
MSSGEERHRISLGWEWWISGAIVGGGMVMGEVRGQKARLLPAGERFFDLLMWR